MGKASISISKSTFFCSLTSFNAFCYTNINLMARGKEYIKNKGQVFTPTWIVKLMLDFGNYNTSQILKKHVIDNSCGNGAFLMEIVHRYCTIARNNNIPDKEIAKDLQIYIHGIEIDTNTYQECIHNLNNLIKEFNLHSVNWDILNADTLTIDRYNNKMDYVFGNPPYVRVHNLSTEYKLVKQFSFSQQGMTDLYIVFFEIGFQMLSPIGKMCLITPISWLNSAAGLMLRKTIFEKHFLSGIIDFEHYQIFNVTTYNIISKFENDKTDTKFEYYHFEEDYKIVRKQDTLSFDDVLINNKFYIATTEQLSLLRNIRNIKIKNYARVKNGFATLADKIFIGDFDFEDCTIDVLKASNGKWSKIIFPYDTNGNPLIHKEFQKHKRAYKYMLLHKNELSHNSDIKDENLWYLFGRSQAIKDVFNDKIAINSIIRDEDSIKLEFVPTGKGIYSGLYILTNESFETIREIIISKDFIEYLQLLKNYKSGGYYTLKSATTRLI